MITNTVEVAQLCPLRNWVKKDQDVCTVVVAIEFTFVANTYKNVWETASKIAHISTRVGKTLNNEGSVKPPLYEPYGAFAP